MACRQTVSELDAEGDPDPCHCSVSVRSEERLGLQILFDSHGLQLREVDLIALC